MKNVIEWIKTNPIVTACAAVSLLGLVIIAYAYVVSAPKYVKEKSEELKQQVQRQNALMRVAVRLPNEDPNAPPDIHSVVINPTVITEVRSIYSKIQTQYDGILANAQSKNSLNHAQVLLGGSSIWPNASPTQFFDLYVRAASDYKDHFKALFDTQNANNWNMPRMAASNPPTQEELELILAQSAFDYINSVGAQAATDLTDTQASQLYAEQRVQLMNALTNRARSIHLYVDLPAEEDRFAPEPTDESTPAPAPPATTGFGFSGSAGGSTAQNPGFPAGYPFRIEPWAFSDQPPTPDQLWEGQVQLWIMRDIMGTIARFNRVGETVQVEGPDGIKRNEAATVVNSPVKRLLTLQTLPGYVGMHNTGIALGGSSDSEFSALITETFAAPAIPGQPGSGLTGASVSSVYPTPPIKLAPKEATDRAVEHFGITPTGRVSNSVFDVRHTRLSVDIEAAKLPSFMELLQETNFMTVIKIEITDLDEYEMLQEGYVYGHADVVRADLVVESLWFRNWTEPLMPDIVKEKLLIKQPQGIDPNTGLPVQ
ncbi:MAG: hypothetical protein AAGB26_05055 [Planctomycetota bacterium]